jgi:TatD DNase family protein
MLTDTHAHLDFPDFSADLDAILARADAAGVKRIITIGTTIEGSRRAIALAERYPQVWATVGVHPSNADEAPDDVQTPLRELAAHPKVVALGECGLDCHRLPSSRMHEAAVATQALGNETPADVAASIRDGAYKAKQAHIFRQQLDLAVELGLNVVIHERDAWTDTLDLLEPYTGRLRAVFHCFGKSIDHARQVIERGHLVSFTGIVTFKNAGPVKDTVANVPVGAFMVETDCPFLAPVPFRGKRCEPAHVRDTASYIASHRGVSLEAIAAEAEATADRFFRFSDR